jgi:dipeptidyl aminopeptidase/acylaminoacyl peptidase
MINRVIRIAGVLLAGASAVAAGPTFAQGEPPLLPRKHIFGNPTRASATVSPDGTKIALLAPRDGVLNVWVGPVSAVDQAKPVTSEKVRPVLQYYWAPDSGRILYVQDEGGNENYALHGVDLATGKETKYTQFAKTQVRVEGSSPRVPAAILISANNRNPRFHDVYRLELASGQMTLVRENNEYVGFVSDFDLKLAYGFKPAPGGGFVNEKLDADGKGKPVDTIGGDDALTTSPLGVTADGRTLYMRDSRGRNTSVLKAVDIATGKETILGSDERADVTGVIAHPLTGVVEAYSVNYLKNEWYPVGDTLKDDIAFLNREARGEWSVTSRSNDSRWWTLMVDRVSEPVSFHLYDRQAKKLVKLFTARPDLEGKPLASMRPVEIKSRDGLTLVSYLSLPPGADRNGDGRPDKPLPMVLNVHGGPWYRDKFGYHPEHQWLANRGYAVLSVNYRGSTGFGKSFLNAADKQFGAKMHDDLIDAVEWAIKDGITARDKVAIYGGSYGGYATLVGLTFTPDAFACGVDIVGPSSLVTLIESFPAYWQPILEATWYRRVGDPRTEEGKQFLLSRSPITKVDQIRKPLLIAQGANDPRVTQKESDQLVAAMKARNIPVTYVIYADEGHGFARPENRTSFYAITEGFLARCLGGRQEPLGADLKGANLKVPEGAANIPGLADALKM